MPIAILKYKLPEEQSDFTLANHGADFYIVLFDVLNDLQGKLKHGHDYKDIDDAIERIRTFISDSLLDRGIDIFTLVE